MMALEDGRQLFDPATIAYSAYDFRYNEILRTLVTPDEWKREYNPTLITLTRAAGVLCCDIRTMSAAINDEFPFLGKGLHHLHAWCTTGEMKPGPYELPLVHKGSFGTRGLPLSFRNIMDGTYRGRGPLPYYYAGSILGVNQWSIYAWHWGISPVPAVAIKNLEDARKAGYIPQYAVPELTKIQWKRVAREAGIVA